MTLLLLLLLNNNNNGLTLQITAYFIMVHTHHPNDGSKDLRNAGNLLPDYMAP